MEVPKDLMYTREHEWLRIDGNKGVIGITAFAQDQLGDVVFVELPKEGSDLQQESTFGVVESVKTVSDLYAPASGKVSKVNKELEAHPELINQEPYGKGWIVEVELKDAKVKNGLLSAEDYENFLKEQNQ
ncbi:Glycine cleavage system, H protein [Nitrospina gracilis 3/211]|uniref:Glycine cleavage system H protein n=1 Tax=Nitrospina gracilis (strain 3/211) TaxID=1266370 RepID=M1YWG6_NITG3|nr:MULTISPECIES: glycine cleavage system protein GcvH [Nitrospina]MCF8722387.1 glycine cleavage system H protein [Nitrospina sp. Nb-3]CCQ90001.1 Glycine cleavage system, H protein [Nitrospina gracilis 3/211]